MVLNGKCSDWTDVLSGVPQGSVLGPILFLIFINYLEMEVKRLGIVRKFADDTKLGHRASTDKERSEMQEALDALVAWAEKWGMEFNVAKCKVMHLGNNNIRQAYKMNGQQLGISGRGSGHWGGHGGFTEAICPMQESGQNGTDGTGPAGQRHPQQG